MFEKNPSQKFFMFLRFLLLLMLIAIVVWYGYMAFRFFRENQKATNNIHGIFNIK